MYTRDRRTQSNLYSPEQVKRVLNGSGTDIANEVDSDYIVFCPYHNNYRTPAAEVSKTSGSFYCFSCQITKTLVEFVMFTSGRSFFEATRFIKSKEQETDLTTEINKQLFKKPDYVQFDELILKRLNNNLGASDRAKDYYKYRKITSESWNKFGLGYSEKQDMITIPVHSPDGIPLGFVGRSIEGKEFKNSTGLPKSKVLFNLHRVKTSNMIYVVESSFDVIRLDQVGFPAVATLGANVSKIQIDLLQKYFNNVIVIADNDEAGGNMKDKIIEKLGSRVSLIQLDKKYKDIGDMDDEAIKNIDQSFDNSILSMLK